MTKSLSKTLLVFIPILITAVIVRFLQLKSAVDFHTGFYYSDAGILSSLLYIVFFIGFALLIAVAFYDKKTGNVFYSKKIEAISGTDIQLLGLMFGIGGASLIYGIVSGLFSGSGGIISVILGLIGYGSVCAVLIIKKRAVSVSGFLMLFISAYYTIKMILLFMSNLVLTHMSDYLIELLICIFAVIFYLSAGRVYSLGESRFTRVKLAVSGFCALGLLLSETVSKMIFWFTSSDSFLRELNSDNTIFIMPDALHAAECIIIFTFLFLLLKKNSDNYSEDNAVHNSYDDENDN